jgi:hypothetical protein
MLDSGLINAKKSPLASQGSAHTPTWVRPMLDAESLGKSGRGGEIRTHDLLYPKQARYQPTLRPVPAIMNARISTELQW